MELVVPEGVRTWLKLSLGCAAAGLGLFELVDGLEVVCVWGRDLAGEVGSAVAEGARAVSELVRFGLLLLVLFAAPGHAEFDVEVDFRTPSLRFGWGFGIGTGLLLSVHCEVGRNGGE